MLLNMTLVSLNFLQSFNNLFVFDDIVTSTQNLQQFLFVFLLFRLHFLNTRTCVYNLVLNGQFLTLEDLESDSVLDLAVVDAEVDDHDLGRDLWRYFDVLRRHKHLQVEVLVDLDLLLEHLHRARERRVNARGQQ